MRGKRREKYKGRERKNKEKRKYVFRCKGKDKWKKLNIFYTFIPLIYKEIKIQM